MKKIKKFKINLRPREILRLLKATTQISEITPELEEAVKRESARLSRIISPAAVYDTNTWEKIPIELAPPAIDKWVAASTCLITIGTAVEAEINEARQRGEGILAQMLHAIAVEALEQTGNFVKRLIGEEAKEEGCELSKEQLINTPPAWEKFIQIIPGDKIGVQLLDKETFQPMYSSAGVIYWIPLKKRSK